MPEHDVHLSTQQQMPMVASNPSSELEPITESISPLPLEVTHQPLPLSKCTEIFCCYAHEDESLLNKLKAHLRPLQRNSLIDFWYDRDISAGTEWEQQIDKHLSTADIILLLISPDFMDSDYCYGIEMKKALERHERGEARVIPVILRPVNWQNAPFGKLQALPTNAEPVTSHEWHTHDQAFFNISQGIEEIVAPTRLVTHKNEDVIQLTSSVPQTISLSKPLLSVVLFCTVGIIIGVPIGLWLFFLGQLPVLLLTFVFISAIGGTFIVGKWLFVKKLPPKKIGQQMKSLSTKIVLGILLVNLILVAGLTRVPNPLLSVHVPSTVPSSSIGKLIFIQHLYSGLWANDVAWSPNGKYVASANGNNTVWVLDATYGSNIYIHQDDTCHGHSCWINAVAWSPDSKRIASASGDGTVQVWDATTGDNTYNYRGHTKGVWAVAWSPDGKYLASAGGDRTVQIWDAITGRKIYSYQGHTKGVWAVAWSPDGNRIASASDDGTVQVWDATTGRNVYTYRGHLGSVFAVAWSPNGNRIASASGDGTVQVWDATTGRNVYTYRGHAISVQAIKWSPNGNRIASASDDGTVQVWDAVDGSNVYTYRGHHNGVFGVTWSPDSKRIASASHDGTIQAWWCGLSDS